MNERKLKFVFLINRCCVVVSELNYMYLNITFLKRNLCKYN